MAAPYEGAVPAEYVLFFQLIKSFFYKQSSKFDILLVVPNGCEFVIGPYFGVTPASTCNTSSDVSAGGWNGLIAGKGLIVNTNSSCDLTMNVGLDVNGDVSAEFDFDTECFDVSTTNCVTTIGLASAGTSGTVDVVTNVTCSGADIVIDTTTLNFNSCGLFTGETQEIRWDKL